MFSSLFPAWEVSCWCVASVNPRSRSGTPLRCQQSLVGPTPRPPQGTGHGDLGTRWGSCCTSRRRRLPHPQAGHPGKGQGTGGQPPGCPGSARASWWAGRSLWGAPTPQRLRSPSNLSQLHYSWPAQRLKPNPTAPVPSSGLRTIFPKAEGGGGWELGGGSGSQTPWGALLTATCPGPCHLHPGASLRFGVPSDAPSRWGALPPSRCPSTFPRLL